MLQTRLRGIPRKMASHKSLGSAGRSFALYVMFSIISVCCVAQTGSLTTLYSFCSQAKCADGNSPWSSLVQAEDGNFYGTTLYGGNLNVCTLSGAPVGCGTVFKLTPAGVLTTLHSFNATDGAFPYAGLTQGGDGNFYGTTTYGGNLDDCSDNGTVGGCGVIFKITASGEMTILHTFANTTDGANPNAGLIQGSDGNFYGTTLSPTGGPCCGTIFRITSSGAFATLHLLDGFSDGSSPANGVIEGNDSNLYGTTEGGGSAGYGTAFQLSSSGSYSVVANFTNAGYASGIVQYSDGYFYGTTGGGGSNGLGSFFAVAGDEVSTLYSFAGGTAGGDPQSGVFGASDGNFYGTGTEYTGNIFKITPFYSKLTNLYTFPPGEAGVSFPASSLIQGSDGAFYGTNVNAGSGNGTVYRLAVSPSLSPPVQLSLSADMVNLGSSVTLSWQVLNAFSNTMEQCYAFVQNAPNGSGTWTGKQLGTYSSSTRLFTGSATITPTAAGTYTYALTCGGQESGFATLAVAASKQNSATTLTASPNPASVGQSVSLIATVTGSSATPSGTVTFRADDVTLGSASLNGSGIATLSASSKGIAPGSYPVIATYNGNSAYNTSASKALTVSLTKATTSTVLSVTPNPVTPPSFATLTATLTRTASGTAGVPTGAVTFSCGNVILGAAKLDASGVAVIAAGSAGIAVGTYPVVANYAGDSSDTSSASPAVFVTVK